MKNVISTYLFGGQIDPMGGHSEAINTFDMYLHQDQYATQQEFDDVCETLVMNLEADQTFTFYDEEYNSDELLALYREHRLELFEEYKALLAA